MNLWGQLPFAKCISPDDSGRCTLIRNIIPTESRNGAASQGRTPPRHSDAPAWIGELAEQLAARFAAALQEGPGSLPAKPLPLLLDRAAAAEFVGVAVSTWDKLNAARACPAPVKCCGPRWKTEELKLWAALGCPDRHGFEAIQRQRRSGGNS
jgi:hypothetical protein